MSEERNWQDLIIVWQGLAKVRYLLSSIQTTGLPNINEHYLQRSFPEHKFELIMSHKDQLLQALAQHDNENKDIKLDESVKMELEQAREWLKNLGDEITINKQNDNFMYQFVLKSEEQKNQIAGFVRIESKTNSSHKALLSWQDAPNPILFLAEIKSNKMYFHVNYGSEGLAVIQEMPDGYKWTHSTKSEYIELSTSPYGSVFMNEETKQIRLLDGNIAAAKALSHSKTVGKNGKTLFENNIALMKMYKDDMKNLFLGV
jgi:hypothetical protein